MGTDSVHFRYGPRGSTRSTRWMAVSCARRACTSWATTRPLTARPGSRSCPGRSGSSPAALDAVSGPRSFRRTARTGSPGTSHFRRARTRRGTPRARSHRTRLPPTCVPLLMPPRGFPPGRSPDGAPQPRYLPAVGIVLDGLPWGRRAAAPLWPCRGGPAGSCPTLGPAGEPGPPVPGPLGSGRPGGHRGCQARRARRVGMSPDQWGAGRPGGHRDCPGHPDR
jgi:hypothetical protein